MAWRQDCVTGMAMIKDALIADVPMPASAPASLDARLAEAQGLFQDNQPVRAEPLLRDLHADAPAREDVAVLLAEVQRSQGHLSAAAATLLAACRANGFEPDLSVRCAAFARQCDRHAVAARICAGALARGPATPDLLTLAGNIAREAGDFAAARARYLEALAAGVDLGRQHVLAALANTRRYTDPADADIARFAQHFADSRFPPRSRASAGFALAKAQDDLADYAAAAASLRAANAMVRAVQPWDAAAWRQFVDARLGERVVAAASQDPDFRPVFIVGVPRSGTTLTATRLALASGARDRGELRVLRFIAGQLRAGGHLGDAAALAEAAALYRTLAVQDDAPAPCYIDQDPLNFRWLDIVAAMFPRARVIHLRRDPRDTALSLWSQDFAHPDLAFASDFADIAAFLHGHDALMRHWRQVLPLAIFELDYEALVAEPEAMLATLCDFIGAPVMSTIAADTAPVQSASVWQARQPVYTTSIERWRHYADYVPGLARFAAQPTTVQ